VFLKKYLFIVLSFFLLAGSSFAQRRKSKYELFGSLGFSSFLGDLGGANQIGTHFIKDLDPIGTRPVISGGIRIKPYSFLGVKGVLTLGILRGDDRWTNERFRNNRNLNFRAPIVELSTQAEFYFIRERAVKVYSFRSIGKKKKNLSAYTFLGVGGLFFVPQGRYEGKWYNLKPLSTEGQGLPGGPKPYSLFTLVIPYGIGGRWTLDRKLSVSAEIGLRYAFSDYIDDVSTDYYDQQTLIAQKGVVAANLADPSTGDIPGATEPSPNGIAAQRGNPKDNDAYSFIQFSINYKVYNKTKRKTRAKF
jgi:hypothetical protein